MQREGVQNCRTGGKRIVVEYGGSQESEESVTQDRTGDTQWGPGQKGLMLKASEVWTLSS